MISSLLTKKGACTAFIAQETKGDYDDLKQNLDKEKFAEKYYHRLK